MSCLIDGVQSGSVNGVRASRSHREDVVPTHPRQRRDTHALLTSHTYI